jgi:hypothetical protein
MIKSEPLYYKFKAMLAKRKNADADDKEEPSKSTGDGCAEETPKKEHVQSATYFLGDGRWLCEKTIWYDTTDVHWHENTTCRDTKDEGSYEKAALNDTSYSSEEEDDDQDS